MDHPLDEVIKGLLTDFFLNIAAFGDGGGFCIIFLAYEEVFLWFYSLLLRLDLRVYFFLGCDVTISPKCL